MGKVNGIDVATMSKINGKSLSSISRLMGIPTSLISGWPGPSPGCVSQYFSFGMTPGMACGSPAQPYDFDFSNQKLYQNGYCGNESFYADEGFYVDETSTIYRWSFNKGSWSWNIIGPCI